MGCQRGRDGMSEGKGWMSDGKGWDVRREGMGCQRGRDGMSEGKGWDVIYRFNPVTFYAHHNPGT